MGEACGSCEEGRAVLGTRQKKIQRKKTVALLLMNRRMRTRMSGGVRGSGLPPLPTRFHAPARRATAPRLDTCQA